MLIRSGIETRGAHAVVVGPVRRSSGKPMAKLLMQTGPGGDATVTVCHSGRATCRAVSRSADILIAAIGKPEFVTGDMVKPGAVVIDVGINRVDDASRPRGYRLAGDVHYAGARDGLGDHAGAGRRGSDDDRDAAAEHAAGDAAGDAVTLPLPFGPAGLDPAEVWSVSDLNQAARGLIEQDMPPSGCAVR